MEEGKCGICIEPENAGELAKALLRLCEDEDLGERLGKNGRKLVEQRFDRNRLASNYLALIEGVAGKPVSRANFKENPVD